MDLEYRQSDRSILVATVEKAGGRLRAPAELGVSIATIAVMVTLITLPRTNQAPWGQANPDGGPSAIWHYLTGDRYSVQAIMAQSLSAPTSC